MADLARHYVRIVDAFGSLLPGATIEVKSEEPGQPLADLFSDREGLVSIVNPFNIASAPACFVTPSLVFFHVAGGSYQIKVTVGASVEIRNYVGIGTNQETDVVGGVGAFTTLTVTDLTVDGEANFTSTSHVGMAGGTTAQRPGSPTIRDLRYNSDEGTFEYFDGTGWNSLSLPPGPPQSRLTLVSGVPIMTTNQSAKTSIFVTPYNGNRIPVWNGSKYVYHTFAELTMVLNATNHITVGIYDMFAAYVSGVLVVGSGPIWSAGAVAGSIAAGAGARGTGAGSTEHERLQGLLVAKNIITLKNDTTTYTNVPARQATFIGSFFVDATAGQVTCNVGYGQSRKWSLYNPYRVNQAPILLSAGDPNTSWSNPGSVRQSRADTGNKLTPFLGEADQPVFLRFEQKLESNAPGAASATMNASGEISIGINSTTVSTGKRGSLRYQLGNGSASTLSYVKNSDAEAAHEMITALGINNINCLESSSASNASATFYGTESYMRLSARWMG